MPEMIAESQQADTTSGREFDDSALRPHAAAMLAYFRARPGEVVSKEELLDAVWPETHVSENSLYQCVSELRRALKDHAGMALQTVPRRGYRLVLEATGEEAGAGPGSGQVARPGGAALLGLGVLAGGMLVALAVLLWPGLKGEASLAERPSVLVGAFRNDSDDARWDRLGRALAGDIANTLSDEGWLRVIEGEQGAARYRLAGSIQAEGDRIAVQARLVEVSSGEIVWGETWRDGTGGFFAIQDAITDRVTGALRGTWTGAIASNDRRAVHRRGTENLDAYEHFLIGTEHKHRFTPADYEIAVAHLETAIALDPQFVQAWGTLAVVHALRGSNAATPEALAPIFADRIEAIEMAARLAPEEPQVLVQMNWLAGHRGETLRAEQLLRRAVELAPNNPDILAEAAWIGNWRGELGEDSVAWSDRSKVLNPDWPAWYAVGAGLSRFNLGQYRAAILALEEAPDFIERHLYTAAAAAHLGDQPAAEAARDRLLELKPDFSLDTYAVARAIHDPATRDRLYSGARAAGVPLSPRASAGASLD